MADPVERGELVPITRATILERLAEIDALLDIMAEHDETELMIERDSLVWILHGG